MPSSDQIITQNDHSRSFKVIRFGVNEEPLRGYIVQYNNCGHECEGSEDIASERSENRRPLTNLTPPFQQTPANIHINLTLLETRFPGLSLHIFEHFCPKARNANSLVGESETDFNAKWSFKVIYFDVTEEPLWDYMALYNNCGLRCGSSEDIAGKISENRHF